VPRCGFVKENGSPCERIVKASERYCYSHDPERAEERRRAASRAGKSRPSKELAAVKTLVEDLTNRVIGEEDAKPLSASAGAVAAQLINVRLRAIELERKIKETDELEARIEALEREPREKGGNRWPA
jgi:hypothetical protein